MSWKVAPALNCKIVGPCPVRQPTGKLDLNTRYYIDIIILLLECYSGLGFHGKPSLNEGNSTSKLTKETNLRKCLLESNKIP
jgi:hypothetical protein